MALHDRSGFSTAELLVVVAAGLIIVSAAVPFVHFAIDQFHLVLAAQGLVNQMQYTRMRAVSSNETFRLRLEPGPVNIRSNWRTARCMPALSTSRTGVSLNHVDSDNRGQFPGTRSSLSAKWFGAGRRIGFRGRVS